MLADDYHRAERKMVEGSLSSASEVEATPEKLGRKRQLPASLQRRSPRLAQKQDAAEKWPQPSTYSHSARRSLPFSSGQYS